MGLLETSPLQEGVAHGRAARTVRDSVCGEPPARARLYAPPDGPRGGSGRGRRDVRDRLAPLGRRARPRDPLAARHGTAGARESPPEATRAAGRPLRTRSPTIVWRATPRR